LGTLIELCSDKHMFDWESGVIPDSEIALKATRGGGPGGQAVNKTSNNIEARWCIGDSQVLSEGEKTRVREAGRKVTGQDELIFRCQSERSQMQNIQEAKDRLNEFVRNALTPQKKRRATKKSWGVKTRERESNEKDSRKKRDRKFRGDY